MENMNRICGDCEFYIMFNDKCKSREGIYHSTDKACIYFQEREKTINKSEIALVLLCNDTIPFIDAIFSVLDFICNKIRIHKNKKFLKNFLSWSPG